MYTQYSYFCSHKNKVGSCMTHSWVCVDCGFGVGMAPPCKCHELAQDKPEPLFGTHIREAVAVVKDWMRNP